MLSIMRLWEHILSNIPENTTFSAPVIFNERSGSYYRLIGIGFDRFFNAAFWCKKSIKDTGKIFILYNSFCF